MSRRLRWAAVPLGLVALYALLGYVVLPRVAKAQLEAKLPGILHRKVSVEAISFDPFQLALDVRKLAVTEQDGSPFVAFDELFVDARFWRLVTGRIAFEEIRLAGPSVRVALLADGRLSFADLFEGEKKDDAPKDEPKKDEQPSKTPEVSIDHLAITEGRVSFADLTRGVPFEGELRPIEITVSDFSTAPRANSPYAFSARFDQGASLSWSGDFSVNPLHSTGRLALEGITLASLVPYLRDVFRFQIAGGAIGFTGSYLVDAAPGGLQAKISGARLELAGLDLRDDKASKVALGRLVVAGLGVDLAEHTVRASTISLDRGAIHAAREKDGSIDLVTLGSPPKPAPAKTSSTAAPGPAWRVGLCGVHLGRFGVTFEDHTPNKPARFQLDDLDVKLGAISFPGDRPIALEVATKVNERAKLDVKGTVRPSGDVDLGLRLEGFELPVIQPYLEPSVALDLVRGTLGLDTHLQLAGGKTSVTGSVSVADLSLLPAGSDKELAGWRRLTLEGLAVDTSPLDLRLKTVRLAGLRARYVVGPDGKANTAAIVRPAKPEPKKKEPPAKVEIGEIVLEEGTLAYTDRTLTPPVSTTIQHLRGRIAPYVAPGQRTTVVDLDARLDAARLTVKGTVLPAGKDSDVKLAVKLQGFDLLPLSPYCGKYAGYPIEKGKLSVDFDWSLARRALEAKNLVVVDQLTLGASIDSPDATSLPVKLGLAILTDRHGRMELDVPASGNIDDPEFSVGKVVWHALLNVLEKAVTAPFALLGALVGGSSDELSSVTFAPGAKALSAEESPKLTKLAQALLERPALKLAITGAADPTADKAALAKDALRQAFRAAELRQGRKVSSDPAAERTAYERWLKETWLAKTSPAPQTAKTEVKDGAAEVKREPTADEIEAELVQRQVIGDDALEELKTARAKAVQAKLLETQGLGADRLFVAQPKTPPDPKPGAVMSLE